ncbi:fungal-specific transcription factor domain-containing protein [Ilyonectria destructans]|nr:fungal-specific transcription factor domain-containing protein [Ilyonectria destructans]
MTTIIDSQLDTIDHSALQDCGNTSRHPLLQSQSPKPTKKGRRAARACLSCRTRKVRCDVSERWPCGNCKWGDSECVVLGRRGARLPHVKPPTTPVQDSDEAHGISVKASHSPSRSSSFEPGLPGVFGIPPSIHLQAFIAPLPARIQSDDAAYLLYKGALSLPDVDCQNALLRSYFEFTYPYMPALDLSHFLQILDARDGKSGQISLFLFQAILFAGAAHVNMNYLRAAGFTTRKQALKELFQRARLLYDFNYESDRLVLVQGLLLMSLWYETTEEHRNTWHWIDVAVSQAFVAELHRDSVDSSRCSKDRKLRRRVWWSCFIRDQLTSLGMKRLPRIRDGEYNVSMLTDDDFEIKRTQDDYCMKPGPIWTQFRDKTRQKELGRLCTAKAVLCQCIGAYLMFSHSIQSRDGSKVYSNNPIPNLDWKNSGGFSFASLKGKIDIWHKSLPECCRLRPLSDEVRTVDAGIAVNRMVLHIIYQSIMLAIERATFMSPLTQSLLDRETARLCMLEAALQISDMTNEAHEAGLYRFFSNSALMAIIPAAGVHLQRLNGNLEAESQAAFKGYRQCAEVIETLGDTYEPANIARHVMEWAVSRPADCVSLSSPDESGGESLLDPGQGILHSLSEDSCHNGMADTETTRLISSATQSPQETSPSEESTTADSVFKTFDESEFEDSMTLGEEFDFSCDSFHSLFTLEVGWKQKAFI